jgi:hypothetical protein
VAVVRAAEPSLEETTPKITQRNFNSGTSIRTNRLTSLPKVSKNDVNIQWHVEPLLGSSPQTTAEEWCFLCGSCRDVISRAISESSVSGLE